MKQEKIFSYGLIPRGSDRAKAYLYFGEWADRLFEFKGVRCGGSVVRVFLLACVNNGYVEGSAKLLGVCGQTVRNHLSKYFEPIPSANGQSSSSLLTEGCSHFVRI